MQMKRLAEGEVKDPSDHWQDMAFPCARHGGTHVPFRMTPSA
jgi:hypothetical protein